MRIVVKIGTSTLTHPTGYLHIRRVETGLHPGELKDAVCSPGGSTIAGIRELEAQGYRGMMMDCILAAYKKNKELGK